ncbi:GAF domain-containing protein [Microbacterium sp. BK668]|uniref:sensor histidine kinase n=1 Tax=Microbacterium sp. BK668 TaxID=2512118 RepID=UPI0010E6BB58|nr:GAF domain-containing protein [Microbacterium sp. BK668]TDN91609.1 histidine kinase/DNA gyrase B/HSP90-like ATPase [Microbacterium sp. BK668]
MPETDSLTFPDGPRAALDEAITRLLAQGQRVMRTEGRLRALLRASQSVVEQIELREVLQRAVEAAVELVDAEYGAMGVLTPEKDALEEFIHVGITEEQARKIGPLPTGHGLLGALIEDPRPIRLSRMVDDHRAIGFPPDHPAMDGFLGVPITVRGEVFGNFYLTNRRDGDFTEEDEQLLGALATTVGFAIANARLYADAEARERWASAAAELGSAIVSTPTDTVLDLLAGRLRSVAEADRVAVLELDEDDRLHVAAFRGVTEAPDPGAAVEPMPAAVRAVLEDGRPHAQGRTGGEARALLVTRNGQHGPALAIPLRSRSGMWGVVVLARSPEERPFSAAEISSAGDLASRASIALELARAREDAQRALIADDRRRIARDLHDHVIQQLFGTGLALQGVAARLGPGTESDELIDAIERLDDAMRQIRTVVFALSHRDEASVRHRLLDVVGELSSHGHRPPAIRFTGPVDHLVRDGLATDVVAVARELLSNALRHSNADRISIDVSASEGAVTILVTDDGAGIPPDVERRGLVNLEGRARGRGGSFAVETGPGGTTATWTAPLQTTPPGGGSKEAG